MRDLISGIATAFLLLSLVLAGVGSIAVIVTQDATILVSAILSACFGFALGYISDLLPVNDEEVEDDA